MMSESRHLEIHCDPNGRITQKLTVKRLVRVSLGAGGRVTKEQTKQRSPTSSYWHCPITGKKILRA